MDKQYTFMLRLENLAAALAFLALYAHLGYGWLTFVLLVLLPDVSMLAYLRGPQTGARYYNAAHSYAGPALVIVCTAALRPENAVAFQAALIWLFHIAADRTLGIGLKSRDSFHDTHLGILQSGADADAGGKSNNE